MELEDSKKELLLLKKKIKRKYGGQTIYFGIAFSIISFIYFIEISSKIGFIATSIFIAFVSFLFPICFSVLIFVLLKKERCLGFVNFFLCSYQFVLNFLFIFTMYTIYYLKNTIIEDIGAVISLYSISWAIFGISIATFGIWLSINFSKLIPVNKDDSIYVKNRNFNLMVGSIFVFLAIFINLIFLLIGVSYLSNGTAILNTSYFIGMLYLSSYVILDILTFLFVPIILETIDKMSGLNRTLIDYCNDLLKIIDDNKKISDIITDINRLIDTMNLLSEKNIEK